MRFSASELTAHLGGELVGPDVSVDGASIDSRTIRPGQLYAPIVAERDGHAFIPAALDAGAAAYLTAREPVGGTAIRVRDTAAALLRLGALARGRVGGTIGITGSVGKTTTKDLLATCLASTFRTAASEGSFNNDLGLPLTLLNAPDAARWVVLELGVRRVGDIERQADVRLALRGLHQVTNALAAATVALWCGVPIETVAEALAESQGSPMRMEIHQVPDGPVLVVDCFNAIPASAEAAVRSLAALPGERKLAVLGVMAELGDRTESEHRRIALVAEQLGGEGVGYETGLYGEAHVTGVD